MPRRLTRVLVAAAVPVLLVPLAGAPAQAAVKAPGVPTSGEVGNIYGHVKGSDVLKNPTKAYRAKNCKRGKAIKGTKGTSAYYQPKQAGSPTAAKPSLSVTALTFKSAAQAADYLDEGKKAAKCPAIDLGSGDEVKTKVKPFAFKLGDERWGYTVTAKLSKDTTTVTQLTLVRDGKEIVTVGASSLDGKAPSKKKVVKLTGLALRKA